jgi:hypothetical protein
VGRVLEYSNNKKWDVTDLPISQEIQDYISESTTRFGLTEAQIREDILQKFDFIDNIVIRMNGDVVLEIFD